MHVYLIGMPGAGKSTVGQLLATKLNRQFADLDQAIEKAAGRTIPLIFEQEGETYFRELESEVLKTVSLSGKNFVVATGGGTPCFHDNLAFMKKNGLTIYLKASPEILAERLRRSPLNNRPLLIQKSGTQLLPYLNQTLGQREAFFEQAGIIIETRDLAETVSEAARLVSQATKDL